VQPSARLPSPEELKQAKETLVSRRFLKLITFSDIISRYAATVFHHDYNRLKASALMAIVNFGGGSMQPSELAANLLRSNQGITKLVDALVEDGSIIREAFEGDRRRINLRVTSAGLDYLLVILEEDLAETDAMLSRYLSEEEIETLLVLAKKVRRACIAELGRKTGKKWRGGGMGPRPERETEAEPGPRHG